MSARRRVRVPERIGPYVILGPLAEGGMAELFRAQRVEGGPVVCLKRMRRELCQDVELVAELTREVELAAQLDHANLVPVYDHGEDGGHYLVMQLVEGMDLARLRSARTLHPLRVAYVGVELARALVYVHHSDPDKGRKPLVHCDVTPHNVLVGLDGTVKLSDFGLARALRRTGAETLTRSRGKPSYLSPEQWEGERIGSRSDLFSLGVVLWQALAGTHPYAEGPRPRKMMLEAWIQERTIANERRTVAEAAPEAPETLQRVIEGLLQRAPARTARAEEVLEALVPLVESDAREALAAEVKRAMEERS